METYIYIKNPCKINMGQTVRLYSFDQNLQKNIEKQDEN